MYRMNFAAKLRLSRLEQLAAVNKVLYSRDGSVKLKDLKENGIFFAKDVPSNSMKGAFSGSTNPPYSFRGATDELRSRVRVPIGGEFQNMTERDHSPNRSRTTPLGASLALDKYATYKSPISPIDFSLPLPTTKLYDTQTYSKPMKVVLPNAGQTPKESKFDLKTSTPFSSVRKGISATVASSGSIFDGDPSMVSVIYLSKESVAYIIITIGQPHLRSLVCIGQTIIISA